MLDAAKGGGGMIGSKKITIRGKVMWENCNGERLRLPDEKPTDCYGWHKITVGGKVMWESPEGERIKELP